MTQPFTWTGDLKKLQSWYETTPQRIQEIRPETQIFRSHPLCSGHLKGPGPSLVNLKDMDNEKEPSGIIPPMSIIPKSLNPGTRFSLMGTPLWERPAARAPGDTTQLQGVPPDTGSVLSLPPRDPFPLCPCWPSAPSLPMGM